MEIQGSSNSCIEMLFDAGSVVPAIYILILPHINNPLRRRNLCTHLLVFEDVTCCYLADKAVSLSIHFLKGSGNVAVVAVGSSGRESRVNNKGCFRPHRIAVVDRQRFLRFDRARVIASVQTVTSNIKVRGP